MKRATKPQKAKYPFIAFRPSSPMQEQRIRALAEKTGISISQIIQECISAHLPNLESHAKGN
jgi:predicted DNA-binding protein